MNNDRCSGMSAYVVACIYWIHIDRLWERGLRFARRHRGGRRRRDKPALHRGEICREGMTLAYILVSFIPFGCGRNRGLSAELRYSSLHRGVTEVRGYGGPRPFPLLSVETAVQQPALSSLFRPQPSDIEWHKNLYEIKILHKLSLCARRACPAASVPSVSL